MLGEIPGAFVTENDAGFLIRTSRSMSQNSLPFVLSVRQHHICPKPHLNLQTFPSRTIILGCTLYLIRHNYPSASYIAFYSSQFTFFFISFFKLQNLYSGQNLHLENLYKDSSGYSCFGTEERSFAALYYMTQSIITKAILPHLSRKFIFKSVSGRNYYRLCLHRLTMVDQSASKIKISPSSFLANSMYFCKAYT